MLLAYGAILFDQLTGRWYEHGQAWARPIRARDIAVHECKAIALAITHFAKHLEGQTGTLALLSDSTSAAGALRNGRSIDSEAMNRAVLDSLEAIDQHAKDWLVTIAHVSTKHQMADWASRLEQVPEEVLRSEGGLPWGEVKARSAVPVFVPSLVATSRRSRTLRLG